MIKIDSNSELKKSQSPTRDLNPACPDRMPWLNHLCHHHFLPRPDFTIPFDSVSNVGLQHWLVPPKSQVEEFFKWIGGGRVAALFKKPISSKGTCLKKMSCKNNNWKSRTSFSSPSWKNIFLVEFKATRWLFSLSKHGTGCSTVVGSTPRNQDIVGSIPVEC